MEANSPKLEKKRVRGAVGEEGEAKMIEASSSRKLRHHNAPRATPRDGNRGMGSNASEMIKVSTEGGETT